MTTIRDVANDNRFDKSTRDAAGRLTAAGYGDVGVASGVRSKAENRRAGGAKKSQHIHGRAIDIAGAKEWTKAEKRSFVAAAAAAGFKGFGLYNTGSIHIDTRPGGPSFWGPNGYSGSSVAAMPAWSRDILASVAKGTAVHPVPSVDIPSVDLGSFPAAPPAPAPAPRPDPSPALAYDMPNAVTASAPAMPASPALDAIGAALSPGSRMTGALSSGLSVPSVHGDTQMGFRPDPGGLDMSMASPVSIGGYNTPAAPSPGTSYTPRSPSGFGQSEFGIGGIATPPSGAFASALGDPNPGGSITVGPATTSAPDAPAPAAPDMVSGPPSPLAAVPDQIQQIMQNTPAPAPVAPVDQPMVQQPPVEPPPATVVQPLPEPINVPVQQVAEVADAAPVMAAPVPSLTPRDIYSGVVGTAVDNTGNNYVSRDNFGTTSVTNKYGATTAMTPGGYQSAYGGVGSGIPGSVGSGVVGDFGQGVGRVASGVGDSVKGSLRNLSKSMGISNGLPGIAKAMMGLDPDRSFASQKRELMGKLVGTVAGGALAGAPGALGGGWLGGQLGAQHDFPDKPSGGSKSGVSGGAKTRSERASISPAASRSLDRSDRTTGLW